MRCNVFLVISGGLDHYALRNNSRASIRTQIVWIMDTA